MVFDIYFSLLDNSLYYDRAITVIGGNIMIMRNNLQRKYLKGTGHTYPN